MKNPSGAQPAGACRPRAKTAAERQRDYRARKKQGLGYAGSAVRLDMFLAYEQDVQLESLLRHFKKLHGNYWRHQDLSAGKNLSIPHQLLKFGHG